MKMKIFDAHAHVYPEKIAERAAVSLGKFYNIPVTHVGTASNLESDGTNISVTLIHSTATKPQQVQAINDFIGGLVSEKYVGFGTMHVGYHDIPAEIKRIKSLGLRGIKLHPDVQEFNTDDESAFQIYENASDLGLPILFHTGDPVRTFALPERLLNVSKRFPRLKIICAHLGGYRKWTESRELLRGRPNMYFDTSSSLAFMSPEFAKEQIRILGVENCMFGTDFPMWDRHEELARLSALGLSEDEMKMVLWDNAARILEL